MSKAINNNNNIDSWHTIVQIGWNNKFLEKKYSQTASNRWYHELFLLTEKTQTILFSIFIGCDDWKCIPNAKSNRFKYIFRMNKCDYKENFDRYVEQCGKITVNSMTFSTCANLSSIK